jgi:hypothetical protein
MTSYERIELIVGHHQATRISQISRRAHILILK